MRRSRLLAVVWVAAIGFIVGLAYRALIDAAATHELGNCMRSGVHGVGIAVAGWTVQRGFAAITETGRLVGGPVLASIALGTLQGCNGADVWQY
jgi:hypothetical protein